MLQQQDDRYIHFEHLARSFVELDSRSKAIEKILKIIFFNKRLRKQVMF